VRAHGELVHRPSVVLTVTISEQELVGRTEDELVRRAGEILRSQIKQAYRHIADRPPMEGHRAMAAINQITGKEQ